MYSIKVITILLQKFSYVGHLVRCKLNEICMGMDSSYAAVRDTPSVARIRAIFILDDGE